MLSAKQTTKALKHFLACATLFCAAPLALFAQENSPYSRYGVGDLVPNQNISSRGMGGISVADKNFQSVNLLNPAALANNRSVTLDLGFDITDHKLSNKDATSKFHSVNTNFSYLQLAVPITPQKMLRKGNAWSVGFGLKPYSRVNYKILQVEGLHGIDTAATVFEGTGALSQANIGTGIRIKNFSFGIGGGYTFGNREFNSRRTIFNTDSAVYTGGAFANKYQMGGAFVNAGLQYSVYLSKAYDSINSKQPKNEFLTFGFTTNLQQKINTTQEKLAYTYYESVDNDAVLMDTIQYTGNIKTKMTLPLSYTFGATYSKNTFLIGVEYQAANWKKYSFAGSLGNMQQSYVVRMGAQFLPFNEKAAKHNYFDFVTYRLGGYFGQDYVNVQGNSNIFGVTGGASFPLTSALTTRQVGDAGVLNAGLEYGKRGSGDAILKEQFLRVNVGISVNGSWFRKRKYD